MADKKTEAFVTEITPQSQDFSRWYLDVVRKAELADYSPVKGCMVIRPVWLRHLGAHPARARRPASRPRATSTRTFPLFIPESLLMREAQHVEGFAPQVAWVTKGGTEELEEKLVVRPTSETIIGVMYQKWIQSWRDLPVLINQWANVVRWEKVTRPFLRTTEFLWQEGHTAHETAAEAQEETLKILALYKEFCENVLAMPVVEGPEEREREVCRRVAHVLDRGAHGRRPRAAGRHLAQPRPEFRQGVRDPVPGTRQDAAVRVDDVVGCVDAADRRRDHGARRRQRPRAAAARSRPGRWSSSRFRAATGRRPVLPKCIEIRDRLKAAGIRVRLDDDESQTPGWKFAEYEMRGVPLRLEIGPKDIEKKSVFAARRDTRQKQSLPMEGLAAEVEPSAGGDSALAARARRGRFVKRTRRARRRTTSSSRSWRAGPAS